MKSTVTKNIFTVIKLKNTSQLSRLFAVANKMKLVLLCFLFSQSQIFSFAQDDETDANDAFNRTKSARQSSVLHPLTDMPQPAPEVKTSYYYPKQVFILKILIHLITLFNLKTSGSKISDRRDRISSMPFCE